MASKKKAATSDGPALSGAQQITMMRSLSQQAAAWLTGRNGRSLRDDPTIPRAADGGYDAQELLEWASRRLPEPTLTNDQFERALVISQEITSAGFALPAFVDFLESLENDYGDSGLVAFVRQLLAECRQAIEDCPDADREPSAAELREEIQRRMEQERQHRARNRFELATVCEQCGRLRRGRDWVKGKPPAGFAVQTTTCPRCES